VYTSIRAIGLRELCALYKNIHNCEPSTIALKRDVNTEIEFIGTSSIESLILAEEVSPFRYDEVIVVNSPASGEKPRGLRVVGSCVINNSNPYLTKWL
jgi:hypothetical protein